MLSPCVRRFLSFLGFIGDDCTGMLGSELMLLPVIIWFQLLLYGKVFLHHWCGYTGWSLKTLVWLCMCTLSVSCLSGSS